MTTGGEILGNWLTGMLNVATNPTQIIISAITIARIGRLMK
jgi:hypothetical protein